MKKDTLLLLTALIWFTGYVRPVWSNNYYVTQASQTSASPDGCGSCATSGNPCCSLLDAINQAIGDYPTQDTIYIQVPKITYQAGLDTPCGRNHNYNATIQPLVVGAGGSIVDFGTVQGACSEFRAPCCFTDSSGSVVLTDVVFQNSNSSSSAIGLFSADMTINGTTNSGGNFFTNNSWVIFPVFGVRNFTFGVPTTGSSYANDFSDNIRVDSNGSMNLVNEYTGTVTLSGSIIAGQIDITCPSGGTFSFTGVVGADGAIIVDANAPSTVQITGSTNDVSMLNIGKTGTGTASASISSTGSIGTSSTINIYQGSLVFSAPFTLGSGVTINLLNSGDNTLNDGGNNVEIDALISGPAGAVYAKQGSGAQTLTNTSNSWVGGMALYEGTLSIDDPSQLSTGPVTLSGGALKIAATATIPNSILVASSSSLISTDVTTVSGVLSVTGGTTLTLAGAGTLTFLPSSAGSGNAFTVDLSSGNLISNTNFLENAAIVTNTSTSVEFDQTSLGTFTGSMSGPGNFIKSGSGVLILTGNSTYTGKTYINAGTLIVNGDISSSPDPIVAVGTTLLGTGSVGDTVVSGTIQGGDLLGTLTVIGNLTMNEGSVFRTIVSPIDTSFIDVSEAVLIDSNHTTYELYIEAGSYTPSTRVVLRGASISGEFSDTTVFGVFSLGSIFGGLTYTDTEVLLRLESTSAIASGENAKQVGKGLDGAIFHNRAAILNMIETGTIDLSSLELVKLIESLAPLKTHKQTNYALNQLHPAQLKGMTITQENDAVRVQETVFQRMLDELDANNCSTFAKRDALGKNPCKRQKKIVTTWVSSFGDTLAQNNKTNIFGPLTGYRSNTGGIITGIDAMFAKYFYIGALGAYTNSHLHFQEGKGTGDIASGYAGLYFSALGKVFYANASVIGSWSKYDTNRHIEYPKVNLTAKGSYGGNQILSHLDTGLNLRYFGITIRPFNSLDYVSQMERGYQEHNAGDWELTIGRKNAIMFRNELGLQLAKCFCLNSSKWIVSPKISWVREVRIKGETFNVNFTGGGAPFVIHGYFPDRSLVAPGLAITGFMLQDSLALDLYYNGEFKGGYSSNSFGGQFRYSF